MGTFISQEETPTLYADKVPAPGVTRPPGWTEHMTLAAAQANALRDASLDIRATLRPLVYTDAGALPVLATGGTASRTLAQRAADVFNVRDYASPAAATAAAVAAGRGVVFFPAGAYTLSTPISCATSGVHFVGQGPGATTITASASFSGTALFILGNKASTTVTTNMQLSGMTLDCNAQAGVSGVEAYGLRDGSDFSGVYVTGNTNCPGIITGQAGAGAGSSTSRMCEGLQFRNCHVITFNAMQGTEFWRLDGLFESQLIGCKALGSSSADNFNSTGFRVGHYAEARAVSLMSCSVGNLVGATGNNVGIRWGEWARESWEDKTTFENIRGCGVYYHGSSTSGTLLPYQCRGSNPRVFNTATAGILTPVYRFGDCQYCYGGPVTGYNTAKTWFQFDAPVSSQSSNTGELETSSLTPAELSGGVVLFDAASSFGNVVRGIAKGTDAGVSGKVFSLTRLALSVALPNGVQTPTFTGTVGINAHQGDVFIITATNGTAFSVGNAVNPTKGQRITLVIRNGRTVAGSPGALGALTFGTSYKTLAPWVQPADGASHAISFIYDGTDWQEVARTTGGPAFPTGSFTLTFSGTVAVNAALGDCAVVTATNNGAHTIANPTNAAGTGQQLTVVFRRSSGTLGVTTWGTAYKLSAWTQPADGFSRSITFRFDGANWVEVSRTPSDVPN